MLVDCVPAPKPIKPNPAIPMLMIIAKNKRGIHI